MTLTGAGGIGKTRLALQAAAQVASQFAHGVRVVELAPLTADQTVLPAIARSLGLREQPGELLRATLATFLRDKSLLLVLDNFEHVLPAAVRIVELLRVCPKLKVLATSRSPLHVEGEQELPVPPMRIPVTPWPAVEQLTGYEAVRLFLERAQAAKPDFQLTTETAAAVAEICARLDGLPLAIELAAARVKLLAPVALLSRFDHQLDVLVGGPRDRAPRQQTLRATIDWSYNLLSPELRAVFRRLAVFTGGCTLEAAAAVCNLPEPLDVLGSLVDQSLLRLESGPNREPRFAMLVTMREYALERLAAEDEADAVRRAHADYFAAVCDHADSELVAGAERARWLQRLEPEEDNLRAAMRWCLEARDIDCGLRLGGAGWRYWFIQGSLNDAREWRHGLSWLAERGGEPALRARALNGAGVLAYEEADYATAQAFNAESLAIGRQLNDPSLIAASLHNLGRVAVRRGEDEPALALLEEAVAIQRALGDRRRESVGLNVIGGLLAKQGDYAAARARHADGAAVCRELGDNTGMAEALSRQGFAALALGEVAAGIGSPG